MYKEKMKFKSRIFFLLILLIIFPSFVNAEIIKDIKITGNNRISDETVLMFSSVKVDENLDIINLNEILKKIYETNFFKNVSVKLENNILIIDVIENPIINSIDIVGIKSKTLVDEILKKINLKSRSSYNEFLLQNDIFEINNFLKDQGYYFSNISVNKEDLNDNKINIIFNIDLNKKAKIRKISFVGEKIFKDNKLKSVIISEEYKFWKFISGKKFLNENLINFDKRLLNNFYLNKGYFKASINSSYAKLINEDEFELIFNINAGEKFFFNDLKLEIPNDFNKDNFININKIFGDLKNEPYSLNIIENIVEQIELLALNDQFESTFVTVNEIIEGNKINFTFKIEDIEKFYVNKVNIFGNSVTNENVIRNQLVIDEGDPFNDILFNKSINNLKQLNFFRNVSAQIDTNDQDKTKNINISVEEKPTGEISLGAGFGTSGGTVAFSVKENNFLGNGIGLNTSLSLSTNSIKGQFSYFNPNFKNTDKSIYYNIEATELDRLTNFGYKSNKLGFSLGTNFEYFDDLNLGLGFQNYLEKITTDSSASTRQKSQAGNYWDTFLDIDFNYDKRNQKYQTTSGFLSNYNVKLPLISEGLTLSNEYIYKLFTELYENNLTTTSFLFSFANSLNNTEIKLSERLFIPSRNLRGFESGKIGPKDGNDFVGGNFISTLNFSSTLPQILENNQNLDFLFFFDAANIWGVDYDSSIDDKSGLRSSIGVGVDWLTPIGPLNFSLAQPLSKKSTDITETFRFNLGTTF